jgi:hypothetical protein
MPACAGMTAALLLNLTALNHSITRYLPNTNQYECMNGGYRANQSAIRNRQSAIKHIPYILRNIFLRYNQYKKASCNAVTLTACHTGCHAAGVKFISPPNSQFAV